MRAYRPAMLPLALPLASLVLGIFLADACFFQDKLLFVGIAFCAVCALVSLAFKPLQTFSYPALLAGIFLLAALLRTNELQHNAGSLPPHKHFSGIITEKLSSKGKYSSYRLSSMQVLSDDPVAPQWSPQSKDAMLFVPSTTPLKLGQQLVVHSTLKRWKSLAYPNAFDLRKFNESKDLYFFAFADSSVEIVAQTKPQALSKLRFYLQEKLVSYDSSGLFAALVVGYRGALLSEVKQDFQRTGIVHLIALSGFHVGLFYGLLYLLLARWSKPWAIVIGLLVMWLFIVLVGAPASTSRAGLMLSLFGLGALTKRKYSSWSAWLTAAFLILLAKPSTLYSLSFQFSFAAVGGILWLVPLMNKLLPKTAYSPVNYLLDLVKVSFAAQLGVLPFQLFYFGTFPLFFLLSNLIAIPLVSLVMYGLVLALLAESIFQGHFQGYFLWQWLNVVKDYLLDINHQFSSIPYALWEIDFLGTAGLATLLLAYAWCIIFPRKPQWVLLLLGLPLFSLVAKNQKEESKHFLLLPDTRSTLFQVSNGGSAELWAADTTHYETQQLAKAWQSAGMGNSFSLKQLPKDHPSLLVLGKHRVFLHAFQLLDSLDIQQGETWVFVGLKEIPKTIYSQEFFANKKPKWVFISHCSFGASNYLRAWARKNHIPVWNVAANGFVKLEL